MAKTVKRLFVLLGLSPGVLHTVLCAWRSKGLVDGGTRVLLLATRRDVSERAARLAASCPCPGSSRPPLPKPEAVHMIILEHSDYDSIEAVEELKRVLIDLDIGVGDAIDVTGGRKLASLEAALFAAQRGAVVGYSIIPSSEYTRLQRASGETCEERTTRVPPELLAPLP